MPRTAAIAAGSSAPKEGEPPEIELAAKRIVHERERKPPYFADRAIAAGEHDGAKRREALEPAEVREHQLAAPHATVGPEACAVVCEPEDRAGKPVFGHRARHVRMMMLHRNGNASRAVPRITGREIIRMQVVRDYLRPHADEAFQLCDRLLESLVGLETVEVTDMRAEPNRISGAEAESVLELRSDGQDRALEWRGDSHGTRNVTS